MDVCWRHCSSHDAFFSVPLCWRCSLEQRTFALFKKHTLFYWLVTFGSFLNSGKFCSLRGHRLLSRWYILLISKPNVVIRSIIIPNLKYLDESWSTHPYLNKYIMKINIIVWTISSISFMMCNDRIMVWGCIFVMYWCFFFLSCYHLCNLFILVRKGVEKMECRVKRLSSP
jgi:hypothetical protein